MVILQFIRGTDWETIIDSTDSGQALKRTRIGYPLFSFVYDAVIDILKDTVSHTYWGASDVQTYQNIATAQMAQRIFKMILDRITIGSTMGLAEFEQVMIDFCLEVPTYSISADDDGNIYDSYFCFEAQDARSIVEQLCTAELYHLVKNGRIIKRCERCGKLFSPQKTDEKYCIRKSKEYPNKNCKDAAKYEKQLQRERSSQSIRLYKSINTMLSRRANNAPLAEKEQAQSILYSFRDEAAIWRGKIKKGESQESEYIAWMNTFKKRGNKNRPQC